MKGNGFVVLVLVLALLYIISPVDLIPDAIPVVGWLDDAAVQIAQIFIEKWISTKGRSKSK